MEIKRNIYLNKLISKKHNELIKVVTGDFFKKIIITKDAPAPYYNDDGVLVMSVYDFLLNEDSLDN